VDVDDGDMAKFARTELRRARKEHHCQECQGRIAVGELYELNTGLYDDGFSTFKTCAICREIRNCYCCNWYYGGVWEELDMWFADEEMTLCSLDKLSPEARAEMIDWIDERLG